MRSPLQTSKHPIHFLLYLEWILLGIIAVIEFLRFPFPPFTRFPLLNLLCLALFGVMGLRLPSENKLNKVIYTGIEIGLILVASLVGKLRMLPLMLIILVIRNCFIFERQRRLIITGFAFVLFLLREIDRFQYRNFRPRPPLKPPPLVVPERWIFILLSSIFVFGLVLVFLQLLVDAVLAERRSREELAKANAQLYRYALRIEDVATLQERNRIAREIHDSLGHSLTVFNLHLEAALRLLDSEPAEAKDFLLEAKQVGATALKEVRQSVSTLRSNPLQSQSLENAIASLIDDFHKSTGISPTCHIELYHPVSTEIKTAVYRIIQESLTNICKYARATEVSIQVWADADLYLSIRDNGRGFHLEQTTTGFGLQGMRERALVLGGSFKIVTAPGEGCQIIANFPLLRV
ncbi:MULTISPECIES: sensor histidine kinase [unclassified Coleofasciculus]|uniref:sensor histidine kinase n=1 Tax=unclassified Coleofasciculus TaxID=2692782 RepID=UPI00187E3F26|nr:MULTISPECIES: sensor histidine kinase [unclassified Coleofasciculus]MBE9129140.1 sensor histidine kinase [Coleofasciculus sp. LEGE 07081]MBE9149519.1 sensor histidine kinase [Coleofasciculus sp. LEGE 07092]